MTPAGAPGERPWILRGKAMRVAAGLSGTGGLAGVITATMFDADVVHLVLVTALPPLPGLAFMAMRWGQQRHEQRMDREYAAQFHAITTKALENPRDEGLRSLMRDYRDTYPGRRVRGVDDPDEAGEPHGRGAEAPPALTSIERSA